VFSNVENPIAEQFLRKLTQLIPVTIELRIAGQLQSERLDRGRTDKEGHSESAT
jgi:hypothetical protein